jgi:type II secretory ATPase GspE/PulE/Tfp pilus assembly ATPase PilB-like protein
MLSANQNEFAVETAISQFSKKKLGELLVEQQLITPEELSVTLEKQRKEGGRLGEILIKDGLISPENLVAALSVQLNVHIADLRKYEVQPDALALVPEEIARKSTIIPLAIVDGTLVVAMAFPDDVRTLRDIAIKTGKRVRVELAAPADINNAIDLYYRASKQIEENIGQIASEVQRGVALPFELTARTPVAQSLDLILKQAARDRASDVHIEPQESRLRIRCRIDGILHDTYSLPLSVHGPLMSRLKILAEMDIAEQRRPQDGQFSTKIGTKTIDIRVATMATSYGERATLRILDKSLTPLSLDELGFLPDQLERFKMTLRSPFGTILVGGPTGSGKTTTLYASINQFNRSTQNIITIEDPVEYKFADINQTQINTKAGITFASGLRTILRNDPDVILVGEIRDKDTAAIATQSSLTGRLVLASIHANDAVSVLFRLLDLGIEPYLIPPTLIAALAQRMVRRVCPYCKSVTEVLPDEAVAYYRDMGEKVEHVFKGKGCNMCANTGYRGRVALVELLTMSEQLRHLILAGANGDDIKAAALKDGMVTMQHDGMVKAKQGITTIAEVLRCTMTF